MFPYTYQVPLELAREIAEPNNWSPSRTNHLRVQEEAESPSVTDAECSALITMINKLLPNSHIL